MRLSLAEAAGGDEGLHTHQVRVLGAPVAGIGDDLSHSPLLPGPAQVLLRRLDHRGVGGRIVGVDGDLGRDHELVLRLLSGSVTFA